MSSLFSIKAVIIKFLILIHSSRNSSLSTLTHFVSIKFACLSISYCNLKSTPTVFKIKL